MYTPRTMKTALTLACSIVLASFSACSDASDDKKPQPTPTLEQDHALQGIEGTGLQGIEGSGKSAAGSSLQGIQGSGRKLQGIQGTGRQ